MLLPNNQNSDIIKEFLAITTRRELAEILGVEYKILSYNVYKLSDSKKYIEFEIPKRTGGSRIICAPNSGIKQLQKKLTEILIDIYPPKSCVYSYIKKKGILNNANQHINKKFVINIDLEDFFPSINFGRVRGIFKAYPFKFNDIIATTLAQICCFKGTLPQGAPTSPIISNFICRKLDNELMKFARENRFTYSRYADDITFSTNIHPLPTKIGKIRNHKLTLSRRMVDLIIKNDFKINSSKIRYATKINRQEVTGLIVNKFSNVNRKYIRNVRAMLNAWEKYGLEKTAQVHFEKFNYSKKSPTDLTIAFEKMLTGKIGFIGMIRGKDDELYKNLCSRIKKLSPDIKLAVIIKDEKLNAYPIIYGEGKSDWKHLKAALTNFQSSGQFTDLRIKFKEYTNDVSINNVMLLDICKGTSKAAAHKNKIICVFDRDDAKILSQVTVQNKNFKDWSNNVYSFAIPIPLHRTFNEVCIEHYYKDEELKTIDKNGRRIFLSNEFDKKWGRHLTEDLNYTEIFKLKKVFPIIIDDSVYDKNSVNLALPKDDFADYILQGISPFDKFTFEHFRLIFQIIEEILNDQSDII